MTMTTKKKSCIYLRFSGFISIYSLDNEFVTSKPYNGKANRNNIIAAWKKNYRKDFYVTISPNLIELKH